MSTENGYAMFSPLSAISRLLFGAERRQSVLASHALMALAVYVVFAGVQHVEVLLGLINRSDSWALTTWNLTGGVFFYASIRSGLNLRLRTSPSLLVPQSIWAMVGIAWSYSITGPARGAVILIMMLVVMFAIFELTPAKARAVAGGAFALVATAMVWRAITDPSRYDPRVEGVHLVFSAIVLTACSVLAVRIGSLRSGLEEQRTQLRGALERVRTLATHDDLTGLANRRAALDRMHDELAVRGRPEPLMALALMDIDHFKLINDVHGHAIGDAVLQRFGKCAQKVVRVGDMLARWGGEEFLLVMPATSATEAIATVERVRKALRASFEDIVPGLAVTFSAGVSECAGAQDLDCAVARADAAMYEGKRGGRDRVVVAADASGLEPEPVALAA
jgi:diguanylate cyclase (GGDEF)-like protein